MVLVLTATLTVLWLTPIKGHVCSPKDVITRNLEEAPDAWKLMKETKGKFYLVYHSQDSTFHSKFPCLNAVNIGQPTDASKGATYEYSYLSGTSFLKHHKHVKLDRKDDAYRQYNEFSMDLSHGPHRNLQDFQVIYTDYKDCVLFWYWKLGYQIWVKGSYLKEKRKVPPLCFLLYELLAQGSKHVVYKWKRCPI